MGRYVGEALESVGSQTYSDWEVIVVDDAGPEDGTKAAVEAFARQFPQHRVEFTRHEHNRGVSAARNSGIRMAHGEWLAFLDPDDQWVPEKLERQLERIRSAPGSIGCFAFGRIERVGKGNAYAPSASVMGVAPAEGTECGPFAVASGQVMFPFSSVLLRREVLEKAGGFQEGLPFQNEDSLLIGSCALFGRMTWVPEPLCVYRVHDGSATTSVLQNKIASLIEFDLCARLALWLRRQPGGKTIGSRILGELLLAKLRNALGMPSWFRWRGLILGLGAKLVVIYPGTMALLLGQLLVQFPVLAIRRSWRRCAGKVRSYTTIVRGIW
jgi:glycosyltransferase involved in cell wall biosynthesis